MARIITILILLAVVLGTLGSGWVWIALAVLFWPFILVAAILGFVFVIMVAAAVVAVLSP